MTAMPLFNPTGNTKHVYLLVAVLPLPPLEFSVQRQDVTSITLDWHRPGGPKIDKFRVEFSSNGIIFNIVSIY